MTTSDFLVIYRGTAASGRTGPAAIQFSDQGVVLMRPPSSPASNRLLLTRLALTFALFTISAGPAFPPATLNAESLRGFDKFVEGIEESLADRHEGASSFLWLADVPTRLEAAGEGRIVIQKLDNDADLDGAMIHNWIAGMFVPDVAIDDILNVFLNYDSYPDFYPGVVTSEFLNRDGDTNKLYQRLRRKGVVLDTWHDASYGMLDEGRAVTWSKSTEIREVKNEGKPTEELLPEGEDSGYMWRMYLYWSLEQTEDGVFAECHSVSLSRDIPFLLRWLINPFIRNIPRDALEQSLEATRVEARRLAATASAETPTPGIELRHGRR